MIILATEHYSSSKQVVWSPDNLSLVPWVHSSCKERFHDNINGNRFPYCSEKSAISLNISGFCDILAYLYLFLCMTLFIFV